MTMNWKWEAKVDDSREKQRIYEEQKRREVASAKSAADLQRIERNIGTSQSLQTMREQAEAALKQQARELEQRQRYMLDQMRYSLTPNVVMWGADNVAPPRPRPPLPEEHIVSAITGYRAWNVPLFVDELRSVAKASKWKPFQRFEAVCESSQCDGVTCSCGIYAFNKMDLVQKEYTTVDRSKRYVYGECWLWGRVLECADGYRAQFAYPKAFINNGAIAKRMAEVFGVTLLKA